MSSSISFAHDFASLRCSQIASWFISPFSFSTQNWHTSLHLALFRQSNPEILGEDKTIFPPSLSKYCWVSAIPLAAPWFRPMPHAIPLVQYKCYSVNVYTRQGFNGMRYICHWTKAEWEMPEGKTINTFAVSPLRRDSILFACRALTQAFCDLSGENKNKNSLLEEKIKCQFFPCRA